MNDYLSTVVIYHAQTKRSVVFQKDQTTTMKKVDEFHLADPNDIEKTKKQIFKINKNRNLIGFHKELHKETDLSYAADVLLRGMSCSL